MPSHLTRVVFRSILANRPLFYRGCIQRATRPRIALQYGAGTVPHSQQRTFLNLLKAPRIVKKAVQPPGMEKMLECEQRILTKTRPPPLAEVAKAFIAFISIPNKPVQDHHVQTALHSFQYLQEHSNEAQPWLSLEQLRQAMELLTREPDVPGNAHLELGRCIHTEIRHRLGATDAENWDQKQYRESDLVPYVRLLSQYGHTLEARDLLVGSYRDVLSDKIETEAWTHVVRGFARENNAEQMLQSVNMLRERQVPFTTELQTTLVKYYVQHGDLDNAKRWYQEQVDNDAEAVGHSEGPHASILTAAARAGDHGFGQQVIAALLQREPTKLEWDAIFLWSSAAGKGVDEVERMMKVMLRRSEEKLRPDINTINALVEFSISRKDPYTAERWIALGERWNVPPNAKTFAMQIIYRLSVNDIDGARTAYYGLAGEKVQVEERTRAVNALVQAMCEGGRNFDDILSIVDDMLEHKIPFTWKTVALLAVQHLRRGEFYDAADLLQQHAHNYSDKHRHLIRRRLIDLCLDRQQSNAEAWDIYSIIHNVFKKTPRHIRHILMNEFFARRRSDMACHIFFHMRNSDEPHVRANRDTYIYAFAGFARCRDAESLELVHNQLKLDMDMEFDTELRNSLMMAYAAVGQPSRALEFWSEIVASKEGPTYQSIAIVFRACERLPFGDRYAKPIWQRLKELDIEIDKDIFSAYLGAIAGNGLHDEALQMIQTVDEECGFKPDAYM